MCKIMKEKNFRICRKYKLEMGVGMYEVSEVNEILKEFSWAILCCKTCRLTFNTHTCTYTVCIFLKKIIRG